MTKPICLCPQSGIDNVVCPIHGDNPSQPKKAPRKPARACNKAHQGKDGPLTIEWREHGHICRSEVTFMTPEEATEHAQTIGAKKFKIVASFPDRIVIGVGYPWATGLGRKDAPYDSIQLHRNRRPCGKAKPLDFPEALWSSRVEKYRLVLERIGAEREG